MFTTNKLNSNNIKQKNKIACVPGTVGGNVYCVAAITTTTSTAALRIMIHFILFVQNL